MGLEEKIEEGENPLESVKRETFEETGIELDEVTYAGNVVFNGEQGSSGMYVFLADLPDGVHL